MKRTQSKNIFNLINRNIVSPKLIEPITIHINEMAPTIEIIEINSDGSEKINGNDNAWCHVNSELETDATSRKSKESRPLKYDLDYAYSSKNLLESSAGNDDLNATFNSHCGGDFDRDEGPFYSQVKCLTLVNNNIKSDTSSEDCYDDIEIIHFNDEVYDDVPWNNNSYTIMDRSNNSKNQNEFIYSFKNNKYFPDSDCESSNMNSNVSTSCSSETDEDEVIKNKNTFATSIFNWIPRLNLLSPPLATVIELTEPNKQSSSDKTENSSNLIFLKKSANSWLGDNSQDNQNSLKGKVNTSTKLSTLSQRERRRTKVANILNKKSDNKECIYLESKPNSTPSVGKTENNSSARDKSKITTPGKENATHVQEFDATNPFYSSRKGSTQLNVQPTPSANAISDRVEKLEGNWVNNELIDVYDYDLDTVDSSGQQNISNEESSSVFVTSDDPKASGLTQNVSNNVPSLHLSYETNFDEDKKSCLKRFYNFINCCK